VAKSPADSVVEALLERHGQTYAQELGIDVAKGTPCPVPAAGRLEPVQRQDRRRGGCVGCCAFGPPAAPGPCPADPTAGAYGGYAMRLRLGRARLLGGLVGARQPGQGR
jgi:hypothetical protein